MLHRRRSRPVGHMMAHRAACSGAHQRMMTGKMARYAADDGPPYAAFGLCAGRYRDRAQAQSRDDQYTHYDFPFDLPRP